MKTLNSFSDYFRKKLEKNNQIFTTIFLGMAAFCTYASMYAFRKPFTAGSFVDMQLLGIDYKVVLVFMQLVGYTSAKALGIRFVSEAEPAKRMKYIISLVAFSLIALYLFSIVPVPDNWPFMFLNGFGLGMIYGLVFSYLEGRKITEILSAFLVVSFIVSSGFMKSIGKLMIEHNIDESKMPFFVGIIFFPIFCIAAFALNMAPKPTEADIASRSARLPMTDVERKIFLSKYGIGLFFLIMVYIFMTIFRDIRDNFSIEIWAEMGIKNTAFISQTELIIGLIICINIGLGYFVKNNKLAFYFNLFFIVLGCLLITLSTQSYLHHFTSPFWWMVLSGLGIYLAYIPFNAVLFERLLAVLKEKANIGFIFYMADFCGYLGSIFAMIYQSTLTKGSSNWLKLITDMAIWMPMLSIGFVAISLLYFNGKISSQSPNQQKLTFDF
jgi:hypothetical protein